MHKLASWLLYIELLGRYWREMCDVCRLLLVVSAASPKLWDLVDVRGSYLSHLSDRTSFGTLPGNRTSCRLCAINEITIALDVVHVRFISHWFHGVRVFLMPITVAARSKAWTVFARWNTAIVGSDPTWGMDVCVRLFCVCAVLCADSGLATGSSPVQGVLPTV
jgi:hypothetical protein